MTSRIRIFDHFCKPLVEFTDIPTTPRSWILNGYGLCEFSIGFDPSLSQSEQLCQERYFQIGNLIHVEHIPSQGNGRLPDWTGIILTPRDWDYGVLHITAYQAEAILKFRAMPHQSVGGTPKNVFRLIIENANARARNIVIQPGVLDDISRTFSDQLRTNAYDHIKKLVNDSGMDWSITGSINDKTGNLELFANLYFRRGVDTPLILNNNNTELQGKLLAEQGTPSNHVFGYSHAQTARSRYAVESIDQESVDDYGELQINQVFVGRKDPVSTQNASDMRLENRARPTKLLKRIAVDDSNTFDYLSVGNTAILKETNAGFNPDGGYGFESIVKIIGMDYNDLSNKAPLNIQVIRDVQINLFTSPSQVAVEDEILWDDNSGILWDDDTLILWDE